MKARTERERKGADIIMGLPSSSSAAGLGSKWGIKQVSMCVCLDAYIPNIYKYAF